MTFSAFPYVGGKSQLAPWIINQLPAHNSYVEPFSGSASVLLNKPRSKIEVLNDRDRDIIHFFKTVREQRDDLIQFVQNVPYSRRLYEEWATAYHDGHRPDNDIERAGRWLFIRYASFGGKYARKNGFSRASTGKESNHTPPSKVWRHVDERISTLRDRLMGVEVECKDALELIELYDGPNTVFYCDPPYLRAESDYYSGAEFDHESFVDVITSIEGSFLVSYGELPSGLGEYRVLEQDYRQRVRNGDTGEWNREAVERLVLNFNPDTTSKFVDSSHSQATLMGVDG